MQRSNTIIIGAGASVPFGMPAGAELRDRILKLTTVPQDIEQALSHYYSETMQQHDDFRLLFRDFIEGFKESNTISIDSYLSNQDEITNMIGKLAIAYELGGASLSGYENSKYSFCVKRNVYQSPGVSKTEEVLFKDNWIQLLINFLNPKNGKVDVFLERLSQIHFISFNYDRILERNIYEHYYNNYPEVKNGDWNIYKEKLSEALSIKYVYGSLGDVEPGGVKRNISSRVRSSSYANDSSNPYALLASARNLDLIRNDEGDIVIYKQLRDSDSIFILGFSFDEDNLRKLGLLDGDERPNLYVTSIGLDHRTISLLTGRFDKQKARKMDKKVHFFDSSDASSAALRNLMIRSN